MFTESESAATISVLYVKYRSEGMIDARPIVQYYTQKNKWLTAIKSTFSQSSTTVAFNELPRHVNDTQWAASSLKLLTHTVYGIPKLDSQYSLKKLKVFVFIFFAVEIAVVSTQ